MQYASLLRRTWAYFMKYHNVVINPSPFLSQASRLDIISGQHGLSNCRTLCISLLLLHYRFYTVASPNLSYFSLHLYVYFLPHCFPNIILEGSSIDLAVVVVGVCTCTHVCTPLLKLLVLLYLTLTTYHYTVWLPHHTYISRMTLTLLLCGPAISTRVMHRALSHRIYAMILSHPV